MSNREDRTPERQALYGKRHEPSATDCILDPVNGHVCDAEARCDERTDTLWAGKFDRTLALTAHMVEPGLEDGARGRAFGSDEPGLIA